MVSMTMTTSVPRISGALGRAAPSGGLQSAKAFVMAGRLGRQTMSRRARVVAQARPSSDSTSFDFDSWLAGLADKIVGYSAAALGAFVFAEWLIHLPGLNLILGFPLETAAVLLLPYFGVKYIIDKDSISEDKRVTKELPGLEK